MYSIASLIESDTTGPWQKLAHLCEYSGLTVDAIPHFSWQTAEKYQEKATKRELSLLADIVPPFKISTSGLGVFSNDHKILFLIIVKTREILEIHEMLWKELSVLAEQPKIHYSPEKWIPHISINLYKLEDSQFDCSFNELLKNNLQFEFVVKKFGLLFLTNQSAGIDAIFPLKGIER